jgi:hypothetical protein
LLIQHISSSQKRNLKHGSVSLFSLFTLLLLLPFPQPATIDDCKESKNMKARRISFAIVAVVVVLAFGSGLAMAQTTFTFTQLDVPGSVSTEADGINASGHYRLLCG